MNIQTLVLALLEQYPHATNDELAATVRQKVPGANTTSASISSIKSKARRAGLLARSEPVAHDLESLDIGRVPETEAPVFVEPETDSERYQRILTRYDTLDRMAYKIAGHDLPALIVSGPPGLGKSYTIGRVLKELYGENAPEIDDFGEPIAFDMNAEKSYDIISGTITAPGLILALWNCRNKGIVVLDDCDDVFRDETCLNLLKAVLDSSERRIVSYRKQAYWMAEAGIPTAFEFSGSVVFCTNIDFETVINRGGQMAPHFEALIDRSLYLSLTMRSRADFITRIRQVAIDGGLLESQGLNPDQALEVFDFMVEHAARFYGLSLRLIMQIGHSYILDPDTWQSDILATKAKTL